MTDNSQTPAPSEQQQPQPSEALPQQPAASAAQLFPQTINPQLLAQLLQAALQRAGQPIMPGGLPPAPSMMLAQVQQMQSWQGPYPPPEAVEKYEKMLPGTFDRMIKMAEQAQAAQIEEAREVRSLTHSDQQRGQYLGFATAIAAMVGGLICLSYDALWLGGVFLSVPVMGVARALIESSLGSLALKNAATSASTQAAPPTPPVAPADTPEPAGPAQT